MPTARFVRHITSFSDNTIGTDALNALLRIPGVSNPEVIEESDVHVIIAYTWDARVAAPDDPDTHFRGFGLQKVGVTA